VNGWWTDSAEPLLVCPRGAVVEVAAVLPKTGRFVVARLDGGRMPDAGYLFYEFSDALLFPGYFGWNWNALSDCLRDLKWLPADGYLIVVDDAPRLLADSTEERQVLFRILCRAVRYWTNPLGRPGGVGVPFTVLLLCESDGEAAFLRQEVGRATRAR
jgi:Barstar (barnase inhibitor)